MDVEATCLPWVFPEMPDSSKTYIIEDCHLPISLHEDCGTEVLVRVPPVARAGCGAARTQDALVQTILQHEID